jgi:hypothetical protein
MAESRRTQTTRSGSARIGVPLENLPIYAASPFRSWSLNDAQTRAAQVRKAAPAGRLIGTISGGSITPKSGGPIPTKSGGSFRTKSCNYEATQTCAA